MFISARILLVGLFLFLTNNLSAQNDYREELKKLKKKDIVNIIHLVNRYWQANHADQGRAFWDNAAYHTGNMEAYSITRDNTYRNYSEEWAIKNEWKGAKSDNKAHWKYTYGETDDYVLFGDWQICFQTYIDLYKLQPDEKKIARAEEVMQYQMNTNRNDYWWWVDGLYMVMPVMTKLYSITHKELYLDKLHEYFSFAKDLMYDKEAKLFYRDAKYIFPQHKTNNGKKDFWARGDGWVFAGLAKVLSDLPKENVHRKEYEQVFKELALAIASTQQKEGYWTRSMLDPQQAPGYESSGTAFFTYGFLWGINNGLLDSGVYLPVALRAWHYLSTIALQPSGKIGYVQPIGEKAIPGQVVNVDSEANFGVGAFLLAACELSRTLD